MLPSAMHWTVLRPCVFTSVVIICFLGIFFTYQNMDNKVVTQTTVLRSLDPNCSAEMRIKTEAADTDADTILLIWMWPFGLKFNPSCSDYNITRCLLTDDKTLYHKAHGVFFHHRELHENLANLPKKPRPCFQKWVWYNMESPANSGPIPELNNLFNLTCNYRLDSNIPVPYGEMVPLTAEDQTFKIPEKDKLVCWVVSNWSPDFKRVQFYDELKKHVNIHTYGKAFGHDLNDQDYVKTVSSCKFYLSFENSVYKDYITEKLYVPMMLGTVPVVLGPSRQNYEEHIPADSFIHVEDFSTPKELAERLQYLNQNNTEYMTYLKWRSRFKVQRVWFGREHACRTCGYLQKYRGYQEFHNLNKWYWG